MENWKVVLSMSRGYARFLATGPEGDLLKARLPLAARHPRAAVTLVEALAMWRGMPLAAVISAGRESHLRSAVDLFGPDGWPTESPLVNWLVEDVGRQIRIPGVADFRDLYAARVHA